MKAYIKNKKQLPSRSFYSTMAKIVKVFKAYLALQIWIYSSLNICWSIQ